MEITLVDNFSRPLAKEEAVHRAQVLQKEDWLVAEIGKQMPFCHVDPQGRIAIGHMAKQSIGPITWKPECFPP